MAAWAKHFKTSRNNIHECFWPLQETDEDMTQEDCGFESTELDRNRESW